MLIIEVVQSCFTWQWFDLWLMKSICSYSTCGANINVESQLLHISVVWCIALQGLRFSYMKGILQVNVLYVDTACQLHTLTQLTIKGDTRVSQIPSQPNRGASITPWQEGTLLWTDRSLSLLPTQRGRRRAQNTWGNKWKSTYFLNKEQEGLGKWAKYLMKDNKTEFFLKIHQGMNSRDSNFLCLKGRSMLLQG